MKTGKLQLILFTYLMLFMAAFCLAASPQSNHPQRSDTAITAAIKTKYAQDPLLNPFQIKVDVKNGKVKLKGTLDTDTQYEKAITLAESVNGVKDINADGLKVKNSQQPVKDTYITGKIQGLLLKNKLTMGRDIQYMNVHVETKNGVVYLSGAVETQTQKNNIIKTIRSVKGVKSIKDGLKVSPQNNSANASQQGSQNNSDDSSEGYTM